MSITWEILGKYDKFGIPYLSSVFTPLLFLFNKSISLPMNVSKTAGWVSNSVDLDQTPRSAAPDLGLHCLLRPVYPNNESKYGNLTILNPPQKASWIRNIDLWRKKIARKLIKRNEKLVKLHFFFNSPACSFEPHTHIFTVYYEGKWGTNCTYLLFLTETYYFNEI